jgi:hypothetical protein
VVSWQLKCGTWLRIPESQKRALDTRHPAFSREIASADTSDIYLMLSKQTIFFLDMKPIFRHNPAFPHRQIGFSSEVLCSI